MGSVRSSRRLREWATRLALAGVSILFFLGVTELALRLSGFSFHLHPQEIEFGRPEPILLKTGFRPDDDLFWVTPDYGDKLARLARERPPLIFLGDSCTQFGHYDRRLAELIETRTGRELAYGNLAVAGWSSYQGLRQLERDVVPLEPRVVTLYFGWNDHWIGFGIEDKTVGRILRVFSSRWSGLRLVQLATKATVVLGRRHAAYPNRVSLDDFTANLRHMVTVARRHGVEPMLLTAPTDLRAGAEPAYLEERWLRDRRELLPLHRAYAAAVRRVAAEEKAPLCDLATRLEPLPPAELETLFRDDGIHLSAAGDRRVAAELYRCLGAAELLDLLTRPPRTNAPRAPGR